MKVLKMSVIAGILALTLTSVSAEESKEVMTGNALCVCICDCALTNSALDGCSCDCKAKGIPDDEAVAPDENHSKHKPILRGNVKEYSSILPGLSEEDKKSLEKDVEILLSRPAYSNEGEEIPEKK
jgi:hypothetical protein